MTALTLGETGKFDVEEVLDISFSVLPVTFLLSGGTLGGEAIFFATLLGDLLTVLIVCQDGR